MFRSVGPVGEILFRVTIIVSFLKATSLQIRIFLKPHTFYTNQPSIHTKLVNPVAKPHCFDTALQSRLMPRLHESG